MKSKYYIQLTPHRTVRLYMTLACLSGVLQAWLKKHCCWGDADKIELNMISFEFPLTINGINSGDLLAHVLESHGCELETNTHAKWLTILGRST